MTYEYLTNTGVILPDTADTRKIIAEEWKNALGQDLITDDETPQGVLINAETEARQAVANNNATLANQINPNLAGGLFLDAIWALTGGARVKATKTLVHSVMMTGVTGTVIPEGTIVLSGNNAFESLSQVTLDTMGKASVDFQAIALGAIPCVASSLTKIITPVLGLETVNNPYDGIMGKEEESDQASRIRRKNTLALQGRALPVAITSDLYDVDGVKSLMFRENISNDTQLIDGISLKPHSIWVCVDGGTDADIGNSLLNSKSIGAGYNGAVNVSIVDDISGQTYIVQFDRPEQQLIYIKVTLKNGRYSVDPQAVARSALMDYINGEQEGETGFIVGQSVSPFELASAINREYPEIFVKKVELSTDGINYTTDLLTLAINQLATTTQGLITVVTE